MTVQDCLGGMVCSESRALSKEVLQMLQAGKSHDEILQAMAAKHGESILSAPTKKGFNLMAWVLPFAALALGGFIVFIVVRHWRRQSAPSSAPKAQTLGADPYGSRFEEEFRKFQD
jgi:cytochrome c-type biogenesis protein CcmH